MPDVPVRSLRRGEFQTARDVLVDALADDPSWAAVLPDPYARYPIVYALYGADPSADSDEELRRFVRENGVT